jgi:hypothetical protein
MSFTRKGFVERDYTSKNFRVVFPLARNFGAQASSQAHCLTIASDEKTKGLVNQQPDLHAMAKRRS